MTLLVWHSLATYRTQRVPPAFIVAAICVATSEYPAAAEVPRAERKLGVRDRGSRVAPALSSAHMSLYTEISYLDFMLPLVWLAVCH